MKKINQIPSIDAILAAASDGSFAEVRKYLQEGGDPNVADEDGFTPLLCAAEGGHSAIVAMLLKAGARLEPRGGAGFTPLIFAAYRGHKAIVQALLRAGADINAAIPSTGWTAITYAEEKGHMEIVRLLRQARGAKTDTSLQTRRGVEAFNLDSILILTKASVEDTGDALRKAVNGARLKKNVYEKSIIGAHLGFLIIQFKGHVWSTVLPACESVGVERPSDELAQKLSQSLQKPAIFYAVGYHSYGLCYHLYDNGKPVESFDVLDDDDVRRLDKVTRKEYKEGRRFASTLRSVRVQDIKNNQEFTDAFFKSQDAFVPPLGIWRLPVGEKATVLWPGYESEDFERVDYLTCASLPNFTRTSIRNPFTGAPVNVLKKTDAQAKRRRQRPRAQ